MIDILLDSLLDSLKILPFLLLTYLAIEFLEGRINKLFKKLDNKLLYFGPLIGSGIGLIPQCGFGAIASKAYSTSHLKMGTLVSILLISSDEAVPLLISRGSWVTLLHLVITKLVISVVVGYIISFVEFFITKNSKKDEVQEQKAEEKESTKKMIFEAVIQTLTVFLIIFMISVVFGLLFFFIGEDNIKSFFSNHEDLSIVLSVVVGLIPNCSGSLLLTQMHLSNILSFAAFVSGLLVNSGVALVVLFKENKNWKKNLLILALLVLTALFSGFIISIFHIF